MSPKSQNLKLSSSSTLTSLINLSRMLRFCNLLFAINILNLIFPTNGTVLANPESANSELQDASLPTVLKAMDMMQAGLQQFLDSRESTKTLEQSEALMQGVESNFKSLSLLIKRSAKNRVKSLEKLKETKEKLDRARDKMSKIIMLSKKRKEISDKKYHLQEEALETKNEEIKELKESRKNFESKVLEEARLEKDKVLLEGQKKQLILKEKLKKVISKEQHAEDLFNQKIENMKENEEQTILAAVTKKEEEDQMIYKKDLNEKLEREHEKYLASEKLRMHLASRIEGLVTEKQKMQEDMEGKEGRKALETKIQKLQTANQYLQQISSKLLQDHEKEQSDINYFQTMSLEALHKNKEFQKVVKEKEELEKRYKDDDKELRGMKEKENQRIKAFKKLFTKGGGVEGKSNEIDRLKHTLLAYTNAQTKEQLVQAVVARLLSDFEQDQKGFSSRVKKLVNSGNSLSVTKEDLDTNSDKDSDKKAMLDKKLSMIQTQIDSLEDIKPTTTSKIQDHVDHNHNDLNELDNQIHNIENSEDTTIAQLNQVQESNRLDDMLNDYTQFNRVNSLNKVQPNLPSLSEHLSPSMKDALTMSNNILNEELEKDKYAKYSSKKNMSHSAINARIKREQGERAIQKLQKLTARSAVRAGERENEEMMASEAEADGDNEYSSTDSDSLDYINHNHHHHNILPSNPHDQNIYLNNLLKQSANKDSNLHESDAELPVDGETLANNLGLEKYYKRTQYEEMRDELWAKERNKKRKRSLSNQKKKSSEFLEKKPDSSSNLSSVAREFGLGNDEDFNKINRYLSS